MDVRVVGAAWSTASRYYDVSSYVGINSSWTHLFTGNQHEIDPESIRYSAVLNPHTRVDFAGRGRGTSNYWYPWHWTIDPEVNVQALVNGDSIPDYAPAYHQGSVSSFLSQFVDEEGTIVLGPFEVIYLFDFNDFGTSGFDLQDLIVVVSFTPVD
jgi:hypothetical protein